MRYLLVLLLCAVVPAQAAQIVPTNVDTPGGFGPAFPWVPPPPGCTLHFALVNVRAIECALVVPPGTTALVGWGGYTIDLGQGPLNYMSVEVWHDGGTPHRLDQPHCWAPGCTIAPVFLPAGDGHACKDGDRVFARFWCVGYPGKAQPWCAASLTGHFRVTE